MLATILGRAPTVAFFDTYNFWLFGDPEQILPVILLDDLSEKRDLFTMVSRDMATVLVAIFLDMLEVVTTHAVRVVQGSLLSVIRDFRQLSLVLLR